MPRRAARFICVTPVRALRTPASLPLFLFPRTLGVGWLVQRTFCLRSVLQGASSPFLLSRRATPRIRLWRKRPLRVHPTAVTARYLSATPALAFRTAHQRDRKSTRLNSSHGYISYAVFCLKKKNNITTSAPLLFTSKLLTLSIVFLFFSSLCVNFSLI